MTGRPRNQHYNKSHQQKISDGSSLSSLDYQAVVLLQLPVIKMLSELMIKTNYSSVVGLGAVHILHDTFWGSR